MSVAIPRDVAMKVYRMVCPSEVHSSVAVHRQVDGDNRFLDYSLQLSQWAIQSWICSSCQEKTDCCCVVNQMGLYPCLVRLELIQQDQAHRLSYSWSATDSRKLVALATRSSHPDAEVNFSDWTRIVHWLGPLTSPIDVFGSRSGGHTPKMAIHVYHHLVFNTRSKEEQKQGHEFRDHVRQVLMVELLVPSVLVDLIVSYWPDDWICTNMLPFAGFASKSQADTWLAEDRRQEDRCLLRLGSGHCLDQEDRQWFQRWNHRQMICSLNGNRHDYLFMEHDFPIVCTSAASACSSSSCMVELAPVARVQSKLFVL